MASLGHSMDAFWLIPLAIIVTPFLWGFWVYIRKQPFASQAPLVLLDKPAEPPAPDAAAPVYDWEGRPCGSYLDWLDAQEKT